MRFPDVTEMGKVAIGDRTFRVWLVADAWDPDTDEHGSDHAQGRCECSCQDPISALEEASLPRIGVRWNDKTREYE